MWCIVNLPNGTQQAVKWDPKAIGQECLEKVCKALDIICEMEYFGLEHWTPNQKETRSRHWINLRNRLSYDGSSSGSGIQLMLALRVKFWVPVHFILQESARSLFYMQARADLLEGRLNARDWSNAAKLAALLCQADGIHFNELSLKSKCPLRVKQEREAEEERQRQQQQCQQQQQQQQQKHEKRDKEYVLSFKKRRLSKQKSIENIDNPQASASASASVVLTSSSSTSSTSSSTSSTSSSSAAAAASTASGSGSVYAQTTTAFVALPPRTTTRSSPSSPPARNSCTNSSSNVGQRQRKDNKDGSSSSSSGGGGGGAASSSSNNNNNNTSLEQSLLTLPLRIYQDYIIRPGGELDTQMPDDFLRQIATDHGKLATLKMTPKAAKYWLLQEIQDLPGYGEEVFCGVTTTENTARCDIAVGAHGITVCTGDEKNNIPFSAIAAAKSFRRTFKLEYVDDHNDRRELEIKLSKHAIAAGLYRSITERHAFYVCDKVRGVVTNQFTRDLKGTIASMFKEDTELGKRYVFDIQRTCREVHDQARRVLHERGIAITTQATNSGGGGGGGGGARVGGDNNNDDDDGGGITSHHSNDDSLDNGGGVLNGVNDALASYLPPATSSWELSSGTAAITAGLLLGTGGELKALNGRRNGRNDGHPLLASGGSTLVGKLDLAIREKREREAAIERCVDTRISEAMTCKICMDRAINTMFNPCCHVMACTQCAARCNNCPNCRVKITSVVKIYLPPELRTSQSGGCNSSGDNNRRLDNTSMVGANANCSGALTAPLINASPALPTASVAVAASSSVASDETPKITSAA